MDKANNELSHGRGARYRIWVFPLILAALCYVCSVLFGGMMYQTNDDTSIQNALSGDTTGAPYPFHQFISFIIGYPLSWLYSLIPSIQWWFVYDHVLLIVGLIIVDIAILNCAEKNHLSVVSAVILSAVLDTAFFLYSISYIGYTVVSGFIGTGAAACLLIDGKEHTNRRLVLSLVLFVLCVCQRGKSGEVICCFMLLSLFDRLTGEEHNRGETKRIIAFALAVLCAVFFLPRLNSQVQENVNGEEFKAFNSARSAYKDYPHDSYESNPQIFQDVGWTQYTWALVENWCFMDERVTSESMNYLAEHSNAERKSTNRSTLETRWNEMFSDKRNAATVSVWALLSIAVLLTFLFRRNGRNICLCLLNISGTAVLVLYQLYSGRILYRSLLICLLPSAFYHMIILFRQLGGVNIKVRAVFISLIVLSAVPFLTSLVRDAYDTGTRENMIRIAETDRAMQNYALEHPENIYITQTGTLTNRSPYIKGKAKNIIGWGGSTFGSRGHKQKLQALGISKLNGELMKEDHVFLVTSDDVVSLAQGKPNLKRNGLAAFYMWLHDDYGATGFIQADTVTDGIYIYKFEFEEPVSESQNAVYTVQKGRFQTAED